MLLRLHNLGKGESESGYHLLSGSVPVDRIAMRVVAVRWYERGKELDGVFAFQGDARHPLEGCRISPEDYAAFLLATRLMFNRFL